MDLISLVEEIKTELAVPVEIMVFDSDSTLNRGIQLPLCLVGDTVETIGSDDRVFAYSHSILIELYTEEQIDVNISKLEKFLAKTNRKHKKTMDYLSEERIFVYSYELETFFEKITEA